jgi:hypothetical protein
MVYRPALTYPPLLGVPSGRTILCVGPFRRSFDILVGILLRGHISFLASRQTFSTVWQRIVASYGRAGVASDGRAVWLPMVVYMCTTSAHRSRGKLTTLR